MTSLPTLPPPVDIDNDTKKAIIDGLKKVLARLQQQGAVEAGLAYQQLIGDPGHLQRFIEAFAANREACDDIVQAKGGGAVRDDDQMLVCNVSLNQIQQLLVVTCAKKVFEAEKTVQTVTETVTKTSLFGLIKKTEQVEVQKVGTDPVEERKLRELARALAFAWQLPLIPAYREHLTYQQVMEIGEDLVALRTPQAVATIGQFPPDMLRKAKAATGADFADVLAHQPQAVAGIAVWNRDMYEFFRKMLGDHAWAFFAREPEFFNVVAALDKTQARIYGDVLCYIASANLEEVQRLNLDKAEVLVSSLKSAFGSKLPLVLSRPAFAKDILRKTVDNMIHMNQEKDKLMASFALTCKAMVPSVMDWLSKQK